jgi:type II secretory pathway predicted ATPase ExeA
MLSSPSDLRASRPDFATRKMPFLSATHREALRALERGFQEEPSGLMLLVGEIGTGKTTLVRKLLEDRKPKVRTAWITTPTISLEQMFQLIAQEIGLHPIGRGKTAVLQALKAFLMDPEIRDRVVLIFDEAQNLSDEILEELRLLSNFKTENARALQIMLVGQLELAERLKKPKLRALNQRIGARAMLRPLGGAEIYDYLEHHLEEQHIGPSVFSRGAREWVAKASGGLPRRINLICQNALRLAASEESDTVESRHVRTATAEYDDVVRFASVKPSVGLHDAVHLTLQRIDGRGGLLIAGFVVATLTMVAGLVLHRNIRVPQRWIGEPAELARSRSGAFSKESSGRLETPGESAVTTNSTAQQSADHELPTTIRSEARGPARMQEKLASKDTSKQKTFRTGVSTKNVDNAVGQLPSLALVPVEDESPSPVLKNGLSKHASDAIKYDLRRAAASQLIGHYDNAIWHLRRAVSADPSNPELRERLAAARSAQVAASRSTVRLKPPEVASMSSTALTSSAASMPGNSGDDIEKYEITQGETLMRNGDYDKALIKFKVARAMDPNNIDLENRIISAEKAEALKEGTRPKS